METANVSRNIWFDAESTYDAKGFHTWMKSYWVTTLPISLFYVMVVLKGQKFMESRKSFELRSLLVAWSLVLAIFSIIGTMRVLPLFYQVIRDRGFHASVCDASFFEEEVSGFWVMLFALSKLPELCDTAFIVLRKQKLIFLHWYHHATALIFAWFQHSIYNASGRWFMIMNYTVHSFMYTYFTARALKFRVPRIVNVLITSMQIMQMIVALWLIFYVGWVRWVYGANCQVSDIGIWSTGLIYTSYLFLFVQFFKEAYLKKEVSKKIE